MSSSCSIGEIVAAVSAVPLAAAVVLSLVAVFGAEFD